MPGASTPSLRSQKHELADAQVEQLLRVAELGIQWVAGNISIENVKNKLGSAKYSSNLDGDIYIYGFTDFAASFEFHPELEGKQPGKSRIFDLGLNDWLTSSISRDFLANHLNLTRIKFGESIDGIRKEKSDYMGFPLLPTAPFPNQAWFNYRLHLPDDSPFDVRAEFRYNRIPDTPGKSTFETTDDFRSMKITRTYLTPQELQERNQAKRLKYGYMKLCTGSVCPESGYWEGWTKESGPTDILRVEKGQKFDVVRTIPLNKDRSSCPMVNGQWMWLCSREEARGFQWMGITLNE